MAASQRLAASRRSPKSAIPPTLLNPNVAAWRHISDVRTRLADQIPAEAWSGMLVETVAV